MKTTIILFKNSIIIFLLLVASSVFAQNSTNPKITEFSRLDVGTKASNVTTRTSNEKAVLFYNPETNGPEIKLSASETSIDNPSRKFTSYTWHKVIRKQEPGSREKIDLVPGETGRFLNLKELKPGYHEYRVHGIIADPEKTTSCTSSEHEDIILYVLPPLKVKASTNTESKKYCSNQLGSESPLQFELSVEYDTRYHNDDTNYNKHKVEDFKLTYKWYASKEGEPLISLGTEKTAQLDIATAVAGAYTFFVEVEYAKAIKDKGKRKHATYKGQVKDKDDKIITATVITAPGTPTIEITEVND